MTDKITAPLADPDLDCVGFNLDTQKLLCLMVLDDELAALLSDQAGEAFWRAFIVEDRVTGEIHARQRFRYVDHDSWSHLNLNAERQKKSREERVDYLRGGLEFVLRGAFAMLTKGAPAPKDMVVNFFPPDDQGDGNNTLKWLIEKDLIYVRGVEKAEGEPAEGDVLM
jgi:hypothetical protein